MRWNYAVDVWDARWMSHGRSLSRKEEVVCKGVLGAVHSARQTLTPVHIERPHTFSFLHSCPSCVLTVHFSHSVASYLLVDPTSRVILVRLLVVRVSASLVFGSLTPSLTISWQTRPQGSSSFYYTRYVTLLLCLSGILTSSYILFW